MSHCHLREHSMHSLRQIQKQMRMLDLRLQLLRDKLCAARCHKLTLPCCCPHLPIRCPTRRPICCGSERRMDRSKQLGMMLSSSCSQGHLALIDVKGFDPKDICVMVKDGKVTVAAERREEHNTCISKTSNYKRVVKEFCLPPGVCDDEVTCSVEPNSIMKIETVPKCCPYLCDY